MSVLKTSQGPMSPTQSRHYYTYYSIVADITASKLPSIVIAGGPCQNIVSVICEVMREFWWRIIMWGKEDSCNAK